MTNPIPIQRVPPGLLDLLSMKSTGQNPTFLSGEVAPSLDLTDLYRISRFEEISGVTNAITLGGVWGSTTWAPAPGELWYVDNLSCVRGSALAAGTAYRMRLALYNVNSGALLAVSQNSVTTATGEFIALGWGDAGVWIQPGQSAAVFVEQITVGTPVAVTICGRVARLRI